LVFPIKGRRGLTERENETADVELEQSANLDMELPLAGIPRVKSARRESILARLSTLMEQACKKGLSKKLAPREEQKWFTTAAYIAQVMGRIVRDLDYEGLRNEMDDLKERLEAYNVPTSPPPKEIHEAPEDAGRAEDGQTPGPPG
jgi:hypothetical protein